MEYDEKIGFGSNYEKHILRDLFKYLIEKFNIHSVMEYPHNNSMGDHEEIFSGLNVSVNPPAADLAWNFCEFEKSHDTKSLINEMVGRSKKYLMIITGNRRNPGVILHRFWHFIVFRKWDHGRINLMDYQRIKKEISRFDHLKIIKKGAFDIPWFILDVYESGRFLRHLVPFKKDKPKIKPTIYERYPFWWKKHFAHHFYLLIEKL